VTVGRGEVTHHRAFADVGHGYGFILVGLKLRGYVGKLARGMGKSNLTGTKV
jgi:hypothetical protein